MINDDYGNWAIESIDRLRRAKDQLDTATTAEDRRTAFAEIRAAHSERKDLLDEIEETHEATGHRSVRALSVPMQT